MTMKIKPGDLVVYNEFEAARRGKKKSVMMVVEKLSRLKREGPYYRVIDEGVLTICHQTHIRLLGENEIID